MRTRRIELDGAAGHVAIERNRPRNGETTIRIDSIIHDPTSTSGGGQQGWMTWNLPTNISDEYLFQIATEVQLRSDGRTGSNSDIHDYYRELQRFKD